MNLCVGFALQRSFLLHKIGKSVFVDHFDLKAVLVPPKFRDWPWLLEFALKTIREEVKTLNY